MNFFTKIVDSISNWKHLKDFGNIVPSNCLSLQEAIPNRTVSNPLIIL